MKCKKSLPQLNLKVIWVFDQLEKSSLLEAEMVIDSFINVEHINAFSRKLTQLPLIEPVLPFLGLSALAVQECF